MIHKDRAMIMDNSVLISHVNTTTIARVAIRPATIIRVATNRQGRFSNNRYNQGGYQPRYNNNAQSASVTESGDSASASPATPYNSDSQQSNYQGWLSAPI